MPARSQFAAAIGNAEGVNVPGSLPARNNNPGDLRNWPGAPADASGYSIFPTMQAGWDALETQLDAIRNGSSAYYNANMSIAQMGAIYADGDPNWAANVAAFLGTTSNAIIGPLLGMGGAASVSPSSPIGSPSGSSSFLMPASEPVAAVPSPLLSNGPPAAFFYILGAAVGVYLIAREVFA